MLVAIYSKKIQKVSTVDSRGVVVNYIIPLNKWSIIETITEKAQIKNADIIEEDGEIYVGSWTTTPPFKSTSDPLPVYYIPNGSTTGYDGFLYEVIEISKDAKLETSSVSSREYNLGVKNKSLETFTEVIKKKLTHSVDRIGNLKSKKNSGIIDDTQWNSMLAYAFHEMVDSVNDELREYIAGVFNERTVIDRQIVSTTFDHVIRNKSVLDS